MFKHLQLQTLKLAVLAIAAIGCPRLAQAYNGEYFEYDGIKYTVIDEDAKLVSTREGKQKLDGSTYINVAANNISTLLQRSHLDHLVIVQV